MAKPIGILTGTTTSTKVKPWFSKKNSDTSADTSTTSETTPATTTTDTTSQKTYSNNINGILRSNLTDKTQRAYLLDGSSTTQSNTSRVKNALKKATEADTDTDAGTDAGTYSFAPSQNYQNAMAYTSKLLEELTAGRTSYTDQINALMDQINNREEFSYDPNNDTLFQNYLAGMMASGQTAMQDTMGQAAALTGGYGSTYATSAANQAYNNYVQGAYDNLPDYYAEALDTYNNESQDLYNKLSMYQTADDTEYNRLANAYSAQAEYAAQLYDNEYNNYWNGVNYNYQKERDAVEDAEWQKEYEASTSTTTTSKSATSDMKTNLQNSVQRYGEDSDEVNALIASYANAGYDVDELMNLVGTTPAKTYTIDMATGKYVDAYGQTIDAEVHFYKDGDYYYDDYGNKYSKAQKKAIEKLQ